MNVGLWLSGVFGVIGVFGWLAVFVLVKAGVLVATGAPPYGALERISFIGALIAFLCHIAFGMLSGLTTVAVPVVSVLVLLFGLVGVVRRRRPWYVPLAGPVLWICAVLLGNLATGAMDWLGSVSDWDAAGSMASVAGTMLTAIGQLPLWGMLIWRWCNNAPLRRSELDYRYWSNVREVGTAVSSLVSMAGALVMFMAEIAVIVYGWQRAGVVGVLLAFVLGGIVYGVVLVAANALQVVVSVLAIPSISMPVAAVVTVLSRGAMPTQATAGEKFSDTRGGGSRSTTDLMASLQASLETVKQQQTESERRQKIATLADALVVVGCPRDEVDLMLTNADKATLDEMADRVSAGSPVSTWSAKEQQMLLALAELLLKHTGDRLDAVVGPSGEAHPIVQASATEARRQAVDSEG